jgi:hypothetical protein
MKLLFYSFCFTFCLSFSVFSQSAVLPSGGNASGSSGSASYSMGQVVYSFKSSSSGSETQGVQQSFTISSVGVDNHTSVSVGVYPNPTSNYLQIDFGHEKFDGQHFVITDLNGKIVAKNNIINTKTNVDMAAYAPATYFLTIYSETNQIVTVFKILKH